MRAEFKREHYRDRIWWIANPRWYPTIALALFGAVVVIGLGAAILDQFMPQVAGIPSLSRMLSFLTGHPVIAGVLGMVVGVPFVLPFAILTRRMRTLSAELRILYWAARRRLAMYNLSFVWLTYAMFGATALMAWTFEAPFLVALLASLIPLCLLYREETAVYRLAQERLAQIKDMKSEI